MKSWNSGDHWELWCWLLIFFSAFNILFVISWSILLRLTSSSWVSLRCFLIINIFSIYDSILYLFICCFKYCLYFLTYLGEFDFNCRSNGEDIFIVFPSKSTSRDRSRNNPQWSEVAMSLNPVIPQILLLLIGCTCTDRNRFDVFFEYEIFFHIVFHEGE